MFFFFVGGLEQQVRQVIKSNIGRCINCGSKTDLVEYDKVLKLFFVPVWRSPGKDPLQHCNNCNLFFPQSVSFPPPPRTSSVLPELMKCKSCGGDVAGGFRFCPYCGVAL